MKCGMKSYIHFENLSIEILEKISNFILHLRGMWLLIHAGIKVILFSKRAPVAYFINRD